MKSDIYKNIFEYNRNFSESVDNSNYRLLVEEQSPELLYLGCSDSRVPPNMITGMGIGEMFVHRNIANIVSHNDPSVMSAIQYAVDYLKVKHVVVCGHYGCGGVKASLEDNLPADLGRWIRPIKKIHNRNYKDLSLIKDINEKLNRLVELNIIEQATNVYNSVYVKNSIKLNGYPIIHGWVYDMKIGKIIDLNLTF